MDAEHIHNLTTIRANLIRAIQDRQTITIGGGSFSGYELISLRIAIDYALAEAKAAGDPA